MYPNLSVAPTPRVRGRQKPVPRLPDRLYEANQESAGLTGPIGYIMSLITGRYNKGIYGVYVNGVIPDSY